VFKCIRLLGGSKRNTHPVRRTFIVGRSGSHPYAVRVKRVTVTSAVVRFAQPQKFVVTMAQPSVSIATPPSSEQLALAVGTRLYRPRLFGNCEAKKTSEGLSRLRRVCCNGCYNFAKGDKVIRACWQRTRARTVHISLLTVRATSMCRYQHGNSAHTSQSDVARRRIPKACRRPWSTVVG